MLSDVPCTKNTTFVEAGEMVETIVRLFSDLLKMAAAAAAATAVC